MENPPHLLSSQVWIEEFQLGDLSWFELNVWSANKWMIGWLLEVVWRGVCGRWNGWATLVAPPVAWMLPSISVWGQLRLALALDTVPNVKHWRLPPSMYHLLSRNKLSSIRCHFIPRSIFNCVHAAACYATPTRNHSLHQYSADWCRLGVKRVLSDEFQCSAAPAMADECYWWFQRGCRNGWDNHWKHQCETPSETMLIKN